MDDKEEKFYYNNKYGIKNRRELCFKCYINVSEYTVILRIHRGLCVQWTSKALEFQFILIYFDCKAIEDVALVAWAMLSRV